MKWSFNNEKGFLKEKTWKGGNQLSDAEAIVNFFKSDSMKKKIALYESKMGSGKSVTSLHVAKDVGKAVIVVPTKNLQNQYFEDYQGDKYILKDDNTKLKISVMMGRSNFRCLLKGGNTRCSSKSLPCTKKLEAGQKRWDIARKCPNWVPSPMSLYETENLDLGYSYKEYESRDKRPMVVYYKDDMCQYYKQFLSYINSDVIVMNVNKFLFEVEAGRLPYLGLLTIDEGDEFLDRLNSEIILKKSDIYDPEMAKIYDHMYRSIKFEKISKLTDDIIDDIKIMISILRSEESDKNYDLIGKLSIIIRNSDKIITTKDKVSVKFSSSFPDYEFAKLINMVPTDNVLMMSGTMQKKDVLKDFYGLDDRYNVKFIYGKKDFVGKPFVPVNQFDMQVNHSNWLNQEFRNDYFTNLNDTIDYILHKLDMVNSLGKVLVIAHAKKYIEGIIDREDVLLDTAETDGDLLNNDKRVLISTRAGRGLDMVDEKCRGIILTKYPYPYMDSLVYKALEMRFGTKIAIMNDDVAERKILQAIARGLRHDNDWCMLLSTDSRCLEVLNKYFGIDYTKKHFFNIICDKCGLDIKTKNKQFVSIIEDAADNHELSCGGHVDYWVFQNLKDTIKFRYKIYCDKCKRNIGRDGKITRMDAELIAVAHNKNCGGKCKIL